MFYVLDAKINKYSSSGTLLTYFNQFPEEMSEKVWSVRKNDYLCVRNQTKKNMEDNVNAIVAKLNEAKLKYDNAQKEMRSMDQRRSELRSELRKLEHAYSSIIETRHREALVGEYVKWTDGTTTIAGIVSGVAADLSEAPEGRCVRIVIEGILYRPGEGLHIGGQIGYTAEATVNEIDGIGKEGNRIEIYPSREDCVRGIISMVKEGLENEVAESVKFHTELQKLRCAEEHELMCVEGTCCAG